MAKAQEPQHPTQPTVTIEELNRVLEVGRLLLSVLTPEELEELAELSNAQQSTDLDFDAKPVHGQSRANDE